MTRQVPVGWEVAAGRRSFSAVSFRIRCFCAGTSDPFVALLRRIFCRSDRPPESELPENSVALFYEGFFICRITIFQPPPIISIRRLFLCLKTNPQPSRRRARIRSKTSEPLLYPLPSPPSAWCWQDSLSRCRTYRRASR